MYGVFQSIAGSDLLHRLRVAMGYPVVRDKEELSAAVASAENLHSFRFAQMQRPHWLAKHVVGWYGAGRCLAVSIPLSTVFQRATWIK